MPYTVIRHLLSHLLMYSIVGTRVKSDRPLPYIVVTEISTDNVNRCTYFGKLK